MVGFDLFHIYISFIFLSHRTEHRLLNHCSSYLSPIRSHALAITLPPNATKFPNRNRQTFASSFDFSCANGNDNIFSGLSISE